MVVPLAGRRHKIPFSIRPQAGLLRTGLGESVLFHLVESVPAKIASFEFWRDLAVRPFLLAGFCALLLILSIGCQDSLIVSSRDVQKDVARVVNVVRIAQTNQYNQVATYYGTLQPGQRTRLAFGAPGKVSLVYKTSGQKVKAGEVVASYDIARLENERNQVVRTLESAKSQQANTRVRELEDQLARLDLQIENSTLVAPFSGTLSNIDAWPGKMTGPSNPLAEVVSDAAPKIEVSIAAKTARAQFVGRPLEVVMEGGIAAEAVIKSVAPLVDRSTRTRKVLLEVTSDLSSVQYVLGSVVKVSFDSFREANGFWLPLSAMQKRTGGLWSTMVLEAGSGRTIAGQRAIEVIYVENDTAYVTGALKDGDLVIADGTHRIVPGQSVTPAVSTEPLSAPSLADEFEGPSP